MRHSALHRNLSNPDNNYTERNITYDSNGNCSFDPTTGLDYSYNLLNLPLGVYDGEEMRLQNMRARTEMVSNIAQEVKNNKDNQNFNLGSSVIGVLEDIVMVSTNYNQSGNGLCQRKEIAENH